MSDNKPFAVAMIGVPEHERTIIKSIFKLSQHRTHAYTLIPDGDPGQIVLIDADDPDALVEWRIFQRRGSVDPSVPVILVAKSQPEGEVPYWIHRPLVATRVLGMLDQVAIRLLNESTPNQAPPDNKPMDDASQPVVTPTLLALVVDDSSVIRKQIELELKSIGMRIDAAESGEQAIEFLARNSYDMIFLDVVLPGVDGYHLCKTIKRDKIMKKTPVIMLTSKSSPFDRIRGTLCGCDTYLTKPLEQSSFHKVVAKYVKSF